MTELIILIAGSVGLYLFGFAHGFVVGAENDGSERDEG